MIGTIEMTNKKDLDLDVSAAEKIGLGLLNSHVHFLTGEINEENIEETIKWIVYENITCGSVPKTLTMNSWNWFYLFGCIYDFFIWY